MENKGKVFEREFISSFRNDIFTYRLKDSSSSWGNDKSNIKSRFTSKNICDFIVYSYSNNDNKGTLFLLELKSIQGKSCPFKNLKLHQINSLYIESKKAGVEAYFIFNFRSYNNQTFAVTADKIYDFYNNSNHKSFSLDWCKENGIFINCKLKRVRYKYDIFFVN